MITRRTVALALAAAACFTLASCGGDDGGDAAETTAAAPETTEPNGDEAGDCAWLTAADAAAAVGVPMNLVAAGPGGCFFATASGEGPALQISSIQIAIDVDQYVEESKALCEGDVVDVDAGDGGWACNAGISPQGLVVFGTELVIADVADAASEDEGIRLAAEVAAKLTAG